MKKISQKFKKGAVSFYVVAFSTLILVVIATSFAVVIISEIQRVANDELAQSAYDAALAGVEDAKLAYASYVNCKNAGFSPEGCNRIKSFYEGHRNDCNLVRNILYNDTETWNNYDNDDDKGMMVGGDGDNEAYTCVTFDDGAMDDYWAGIGSGEVKIVKVKMESGKSAKDVKSVILTWGKKEDDTSNSYYSNGFGNSSFSYPVLAVTMIQTGPTFSLSDFDKTVGETKTNRTTLYLVPTNNEGSTLIEAKELVKRNDRVSQNNPIKVNCGNTTAEEQCQAQIILPSPIGDGDRNDDTFVFAISAPYGDDASFKLQFSSKDGSEGETINADLKVAGMQVSIDSTGRADNLYRRVEARIEADTGESPLPLYALELLGGNQSGTGGDNSSLLEKNLVVTAEYSEDEYNNALGESGNWGNPKN